MQHSEFVAIVTLLAEIRDRLTYLCQPPDESMEAPDCEHPEARRTDFSSPRETHWICNDCGHIERRPTVTPAPAFSGADAKE
jgi:hypothetical protein